MAEQTDKQNKGVYAKFLVPIAVPQDLVKVYPENLDPDAFPYLPIAAQAMGRKYPGILNKHIEVFVIGQDCGTGFPMAKDPSKPVFEFPMGGLFTDEISASYSVTPDASHIHGVQELYLLCGTDPDNPEDLGGECEIWLGQGKYAEKYILTQSTCIVMPPGLASHPMVFRNVRRPILKVVVYDSPDYAMFPVSNPTAWDPDKAAGR